MLSKEQAENEAANIKSSKYGNHSYVVPSVRRITKFKQLQASEMEREATFALFNKSTLVKSNVHFDTTGRSSMDGEWPSLILKFSDEIEYRLQPIFFAFEDREQITNLTFGRLIATLQVSHDQTLQPKTLWEKVDAIMTDTITKNTEVEETIAKALDSSHIPLYLLCKTYTVEALDKSSLEVLNEIAKSVKQQEIFEKSTLH